MLPSGRLAIVLAAVLWSTSGAFSKAIDLPGPIMACARALVAAFVLLPFLKLEQCKFSRGQIGLVVSFATMNIAFVTAMTATTAANTIFLEYSSSVWMILASVLFLQEKLDGKSCMALPFAVIGIGIILYFGDSSELLGLGLGLLAGLGYAGVAIFLRLLRNFDSYWLTFQNMAFGGLILMPIIIWNYDLTTVTVAQSIGLFCFGVVQFALPYLFFSRGLQTISAQEAAIICLLEPVLNPVIAFFVVGEIPSWSTVIGGGFILVSVGVRYIKWVG